MADSRATVREATADSAPITDSDVIRRVQAFNELKAKRGDLVQKTSEIDKEIAELRLLLSAYFNDGEAQKRAVSSKSPKAKLRPPPHRKPIKRDRRAMTNREALISVLKGADRPMRAVELIKAAQDAFGAATLNADSLKTTVRALRHDREVNFDEDAGTYSIVNAQDTGRAA